MSIPYLAQNTGKTRISEKSADHGVSSASICRFFGNSWFFECLGLGTTTCEQRLELAWEIPKTRQKGETRIDHLASFSPLLPPLPLSLSCAGQLPEYHGSPYDERRVSFFGGARGGCRALPEVPNSIPRAIPSLGRHFPSVSEPIGLSRMKF